MDQSPDYRLVSFLLAEEAERIVQDAAREKRVLNVSRHGKRLLMAYPNSAERLEEIVNELAALASCAGVAVEFSGKEEEPPLRIPGPISITRESGSNGHSGEAVTEVKAERVRFR